MRKTIAQFVMESHGTVDFSSKQRLSRKHAKMYRIAKEGFFDFFRKKEGSKVKQKNTDPNLHAQELREAGKVGIHLFTNSVDNEIKYLEDLIRHGLPFFQKDIKRIRSAFEFVISNHSDIGNKISKLVDVAYPDSSYKIDNNNFIRFNTFFMYIHNYSVDKNKQSLVGQAWVDADMDMEVEELFGLDPVNDEEKVNEIARLYCLNEAVPDIDVIFIDERIRANNQQHVDYLQKDDPKLLKLIELNLNLIEKCSHILTESSYEQFKKLAYKADKLTHPKPLGDGDEFGMSNMVIHSLGYMYDIMEGFRYDFIEHYIAH